jgi:uncharacterized protein
VKNTASISITGSSNGLGTEFARVHASKGANLILVARGKAKMNALKAEFENLYGISVYVIAKDLSKQ